MKRTLFLLIVAIGIVAISTGCSSVDTQVLEDKISQLEQQLNSQNASSNTTSSQAESVSSSVSSSAEQNNSSAPTVSNNTGSQQQTTNNNQTQTPTNFDLTDITQKVENVVQIADATQPKATYYENVSLYGQVKMQIEQVEFEIESIENQIEYASRTGSLPWNQYYELDRNLDALDHRLDMAKDSLEWRLGVDD